MSFADELSLTPAFAKLRDSKPEAEKPPQLGPNSYLRALSLRSSTFLYVDIGDSLIDHANFRNTRLNRCSFEGAAISGSRLDRIHIDNCSLRGAVFENCNTEGLVINGIQVGNLLAQLQNSSKGV